MPRCAAVCASLLLASVPCQESRPATAPLPQHRRAGAATLDVEQLRSDVRFLADPGLRGRATGTVGYARASAFVADRFRELGLEAAGDREADGTRSYFQALMWVVETPTEAAALRILRDGRTVVSWTAGRGLHGAVQSSQTYTGEVALVVVRDPDGAGVASLALQDKLALVWLTDAAHGPPHERGTSLAAARRFSIQNELRAANAAAWVFVDDFEYAAHGGLLGVPLPRAGATAPLERARQRAPNQLATDRAHAAALLRDLGVAFADREATASLVALPGARAELAIACRSEAAPARNVVAKLRGADPAKSTEHVVLGAHLDHLGMVQGVVRPGADDDASGVAALLAIAAAVRNNPQRPSRSLVFVAFGGEEVGLLGSAHYVADPSEPLRSCVAMIQLDMVGRMVRDEVHFVGSERLSRDLHRICLDRNLLHGGFRPGRGADDLFFRSDHANFARLGIPALLLTTGLHADYHGPGDTAEKLAYDDLLRVARFGYDLVCEIAERPLPPRVDEDLWRATFAAFHGEKPLVPPLR